MIQWMLLLVGVASTFMLIFKLNEMKKPTIAGILLVLMVLGLAFMLTYSNVKMNHTWLGNIRN